MSSKYQHLFFDLDHTIWDFDANAKATLQQMHIDFSLAERGIDDFELFHKNYLQHNEKLWARYRNGYIKQEELRLKRMWLSLLDFKIADETLAKEMSDRFLELLPNRTLLFPNAIEVLEYLKGQGYQMHIITNGFEKTQHSKLNNCGLNNYFKNIITSEGSNSIKPQKEIFEFALAKAGAVVEESIMVGDSIEVDIIGAMTVGMDTIHTNYINAPQEVKPTYTVTDLIQLKSFL